MQYRDIKCVYWGVFFDDEDLPNSSLDRDITNKHITFGFRRPCPAELVGMPILVDIVGYGNDGENEALLVEFDGEWLDYYAGSQKAMHVTLSVSETGKPKNSENLDFEPTDLETIWGTFGYFGEDNTVHLD